MSPDNVFGFILSRMDFKANKIRLCFQSHVSKIKDLETFRYGIKKKENIKLCIEYELNPHHTYVHSQKKDK